MFQQLFLEGHKACTNLSIARLIRHSSLQVLHGCLQAFAGAQVVRAHCAPVQSARIVRDQLQCFAGSKYGIMGALNPKEACGYVVEQHCTNLLCLLCLLLISQQSNVVHKGNVLGCIILASVKPQKDTQGTGVLLDGRLEDVSLICITRQLASLLPKLMRSLHALCKRAAPEGCDCLITRGSQLHKVWCLLPCLPTRPGLQLLALEFCSCLYDIL
mmetsp:Transcript_13922/g.37638  ORF Transcript_13922/g.37638 Transcript_13922/m.37638 type:complete len:215 (+) Transcript_13922:687-1331(+)